MNIEAIWSLVSLAALWFLWHFLWKSLCVDFFREQLFALRDDLFKLGRNRKEFDSELYRLLESVINVNIREAQSLLLSRVWLFEILATARYGKVQSIKKLRIEELLSSEKNSAYRPIQLRFKMIVIKHLARTSTVFMGILLYSLAYNSLRLLVHNSRSFFKTKAAVREQVYGLLQYGVERADPLPVAA